MSHVLDLLLISKTSNLISDVALVVVGALSLGHTREYYFGPVSFVLLLTTLGLIGRPSDDQIWRFRACNAHSPPQSTKQDPHQMIIGNVLRALRTRKSQRPIDRAYALYGIFESQGLAITTPDARTTVEDAYKDLFIRLIEWGLSPNLLLDAGIEGSPGGLSWVPDWASAQARCWFDDEYLYQMADRYGAPNQELSVHDDRLCIKASVSPEALISIPLVLPDDAQESYHPQMGDRYFDSDIALVSWVQDIRRNLPTPHEYGALGDALIEVLLGSLKTQPAARKRRFRNWFRYFTEDKQTNNSKSDTNQENLERLLINRLRRDLNSEAYKFHRYICQEIGRRRALCVVNTRNGFFMSTGSHSMKENDVVVWVKGVSLPLVLTPTRGVDCYQLVGGLIVPGLDQPKASSYSKILLE